MQRIKYEGSWGLMLIEKSGRGGGLAREERGYEKVRRGGQGNGEGGKYEERSLILREKGGVDALVDPGGLGGDQKQELV